MKKIKQIVVLLLAVMMLGGLVGVLANDNLINTSDNTSSVNNYSDNNEYTLFINNEHSYINEIEKDKYYTTTFEITQSTVFSIYKNGSNFLDYNNVKITEENSNYIESYNNEIKLIGNGKFFIEIYPKEEKISITKILPEDVIINNNYQGLNQLYYDKVVYSGTNRGETYIIKQSKYDYIFKQYGGTEDNLIDYTSYGYNYYIPYDSNMDYFYLTYSDGSKSQLIAIDEYSIYNSVGTYNFIKPMFATGYYSYNQDYNTKINFKDNYKGITFVNSNEEIVYEVRNTTGDISYAHFKKITNEMYQAIINIEDGISFWIYANNELLINSPTKCSFPGYTTSSPSWINWSTQTAISLTADGKYYLELYVNLNQLAISLEGEFQY